MIALKYWPFVFRQVVRQRTRSTLTVCGVAVAMFLLAGVQAMQAGAEAVTRQTAGDATLVVYRKDRYCPFTSRMPQHYEQRIAQAPGVAGVVPTAIVVSNCRTSLDVVTFRGVPEEALLREIAPRVRILAGSIEDWRGRSDAALLGETLANRRGLRVGDRFEAAGTTVFVAGIFRSDAPQHQNVAYTHLGFLQYAAGSRSGGLVTQFDVRVANPAQLDAVAAAIDAEFANEQDPTQTRSQQAFVAQAAGDVLEIVAFTKWLGLGCLAAVLALVGNAILLAVQDRIREHAVLQTLGYGGGLIARLIVTEGVVLSVTGGLLGSAAAYAVLSRLHLSLSVEGMTVPILYGPWMIASGLALSVLVGVGAGALPAWQASRREIVESLRAQ